MEFLNTVSYYVNMVGLVAIFTLTGVIGVLYYMIKVKKVTARVENINTASFKREDSVSYVPFKDIVSKDGKLDSEGMVVINDRTFVGGVSVRGFDYPSASSDEKISAQVNSVAFFNVVEKPTSFRQSIRAVDLSENIKEYEETIQKIGISLLELDEEYQNTLRASEEYEDDPDNYTYFEERLKQLQDLIAAKRHMVDECDALIRYMKAMSSDAGKSGTSTGQKTNQIMFSYVYNPDEYTQELSKEEIYTKAMEELNLMARSYGEALAACHFRSKRLSARELIGLMRKHTAPITGEALKLDELLDSSFTTLFVSSDSLVEAFKEKIGESVFEKRMEAYEEYVNSLLAKQEEERFSVGAALIEEAYEKAVTEMGLEG